MRNVGMVPRSEAQKQQEHVRFESWRRTVGYLLAAMVTEQQQLMRAGFGAEEARTHVSKEVDTALAEFRQSRYLDAERGLS